MSTYYLWSGATGSATGVDWTNAYTGWSSVPTLNSGDIVKVHTGATSAHYETTDSTFVMTGPSSGLPAYVIGVDKDGTDTVVYESATDNFETTGGIFLTIDGSMAFYGIHFKTAVRFIDYAGDQNETAYYEKCQFDAQAGYHNLTYSSIYLDCTFVWGSAASYFVPSVVHAFIINGTFTNASGGACYNSGTGELTFIGCDFSNCTFSSFIHQNNSVGLDVNFIGCAFPSSWTPFTATGFVRNGIYGCSSDASNDVYETYTMNGLYGDAIIVQGVYRDGGATLDGTNEYSIKLSSTTSCNIGNPTYTEWQTGYIAADSGTQTTWTVYIANSSADIYNDDCWLEVEYYGNASSTQKTLAHNKIESVLATPALITDDTTNTWTGITGEFAQKLAITATVNQSGMYRWRVASTFTTADVYVCPKADVVQA